MPPSFRTLAVLTVALLGAAPRATGGADQVLAPTNYADREVVRGPVVLLRGAAPADAAEVVATNESSRRDGRTLRGVARKGRYLALAELVPGENRLRLQTGAAEARLTLVYRPPTNTHVVRCVYLTDSTGDTTYQSQRADEVQNYAGKLDTAMKLLQCFTAERMHDLGFGRSTFNLELDANGRVDVHVLRGERPAAEEYRLDDQAWWREVDGLVGRKLPHPSAKNVVVAAYTRFDPSTRKVHGHTALGGGDLGLFGSAGMFAWPTRLEDVFATFADATPIDGASIKAASGVRYVGFLRRGDAVGFRAFWGGAATAPKAIRLSAADLAPSEGGIDALRVIDDAGGTTVETVALPGRFLRTWRFAEKTRRWLDPARFVALDAKEVERIVADARVRPLSASKGAFVDFIARFGSAPDQVAYAVRELNLSEPLKVKLKTGSDDALRVWIDGKAVVERLLLRAARPDDESTDVELAAGRHVMLVEVSQRNGGWGLYLRFEDAKGAPLRLSDAGELVSAR